MTEPAHQRREAADTLTLLQQHLSASLHRCEERAREVVLGGDDSTTQLLAPTLRRGGKKIRPMLVLLSADAFHGSRDLAIEVATAAELIHMATLLHDDVVDNAATRRGNPTLHSLWGNRLAVLGGDYVLAQALALLLATGDLRLVRSMANTVALMGEGEIMQTFRLYDTASGEDDYYACIRRKTAVLMACCCEMGASLAGASEAGIDNLRAYGMAVGMAFQIIDDLLDYAGDQATVGKPVASDLLEGNLTLPVVHAMRGRDGEWIRAMVEERSLTPERVAQVAEAVRRGGSLDYAYHVAEGFVREALEALHQVPASPATEWLGSLATYLLSRDF